MANHLEIIDGTEPVTVEEAIARYQSRVKGFLSRLVDDQADLDDLTQETMIRLSRSWHTFRGKSSLATWIFKIASNVCIDHYRAKKVRPKGSIIAVDTLPLANAPAMESNIGGKQMLDCLLRVMEELKEDDATLLIAHDMEGYSLKEIAVKTKKKENALKVRLHRARKKLKALLASACSINRDGHNNLQCEPKTTGRAKP